MRYRLLGPVLSRFAGISGLSRGAAAFATLVASMGLIATPAAAQNFQHYQCADGSQLAVGFYPADSHAYLQLDGKAIVLKKRLSFAGTRYGGGGITLFITDEGAVLKRRRGQPVACTPP